MNGERSYQDFTTLELWRKARALKNEIFELVQKFPSIEKFRLSDQMIRASRSVGASIAEGHGRFSYKEQIHFCIICRGSLSELRNHFIDAYDCKYILKEELQQFILKVKEVERLANGYITYLRAKNI